MDAWMSIRGGGIQYQEFIMTFFYVFVGPVRKYICHYKPARYARFLGVHANDFFFLRDIYSTGFLEAVYRYLQM